MSEVGDWGLTKNEPAHEIMVLFILRNLNLQTHMRWHPVGLDVWFLVGPFVYFHTSWMRTAKALARLRGCAGSPEPSLFAYVISIIISWAGSNIIFYHRKIRSNHLKLQSYLPYSLSKDKAQILVEQFCSVFTEIGNCVLPVLPKTIQKWTTGTYHYYRRCWKPLIDYAGKIITLTVSCNQLLSTNKARATCFIKIANLKISWPGHGFTSY